MVRLKNPAEWFPDFVTPNLTYSINEKIEIWENRIAGTFHM